MERRNRGPSESPINKNIFNFEKISWYLEITQPVSVIAYLLSNNILIFKFIVFCNLCWHEN